MGFFLRWWLEQLADLMPRRLLTLLHRPPDAVLIEQDGTGCTISVRRSGRVDATRRVSSGVTARVETALRGLGRVPPLVLLRPRAAAVLRKRVRLPTAASANLRQLLAYEIERETPFSAAELYWDYQLRRHAAQDPHIEIELILVPRDRVAPLIAIATEAGLEALALEISGEIAGDHDSGLLHIPLADDPARGSRDRPLLVLAGVTAALIVLAIGAPLLRQSLEISKADAALEAAKAEASTAAKLRQEFDQLANAAGFIAAERARAGSPLQAVAAATRLFPGRYLSHRLQPRRQPPRPDRLLAGCREPHRAPCRRCGVARSRLHRTGHARRRQQPRGLCHRRHARRAGRPMIALPRGPSGRALALALCVGVLGIVYAGIAAPLLAAYDDRAAHLADTVAATVRLQEGAANIPELRQALDALRARADIDRLTLSGGSDALAAASLQATLADLASGSGSRIASAEIMPVQPVHEFRRIGIRVSLGGDLAVLTKMLAGIDAARPPLFVDHLELRSNATTQAAGGAPVLTIAMDVHGFRR